MRREGSFQSRNTPYSEELRVDYSVGDKCAEKSPLDLRLTERYALFQDSGSTLHSYAIHHAEWPIFRVKIDNLRLDYSRFNPLLSGSPDKVQYSPGVSVLAW
nr:DUF2071 domain-containing protein [Phaeocystidibacter marisrubri]